jgi:hypothetical protein
MHYDVIDGDRARTFCLQVVCMRLCCDVILCGATWGILLLEICALHWWPFALLYEAQKLYQRLFLYGNAKHIAHHPLRTNTTNDGACYADHTRRLQQPMATILRDVWRYPERCGHNQYHRQSKRMKTCTLYALHVMSNCWPFDNLVMRILFVAPIQT